MLPKLIVIGAMKAGTSSLYRYIASHPDVSPSAIKETDFFTTDSNFRKGVNWYGSLFRNKGKLAFEASPNYTKRHLFPGIPARMHSALPKTKLVYVLRDPIDRTLSHYVHNRLAGREPRPFSSVIRDPASKYIQTSKYFYQIQPFLEYYQDRQILFVDSDRLRRDTADAVKDVFRFLGMSPECDDTILKRHFHTSSGKIRRHPFGQAITRRVGNTKLRASIGLTTVLHGESTERLRLSSVDRRVLFNAIAPDVDKLRRFSGLAFPNWSL